MRKQNKWTAPKFTVLMPTFNRADVISYAIESVLAQTEKSFELFIVGDGCTDNTAKVVKKYLKDKRVRWFDYPKAPGFGYANRNKALKEAKGKYVAFIGHDDLYFPDHLELLGAHLDKNKSAELVYSRALWVDVKGTVLASPYNLEDPTSLKDFMKVSNGMGAGCFVHRRSIFKKIGHWDEQIPREGDWDLWKRIIRSSKQKNFIFEPTPTLLKFKAIWKKDRETWPFGLDLVASEVKKHPKILPESLRLKVPNGKTEQSIFWQKIKKDKNWVPEMRRGCITLLDHMLMQVISGTDYELRRAKAIDKEKTQMIKNKDNEIRMYQHQIKMMEKSRLYKIGKKLKQVFKK